MTDHVDTIRRVERRYANEVAEAARRASERDVSTWLAGVSFQEWFDLVAERQQAIDERDAARMSNDELRRQLENYTQRNLELSARCEQAIDALREIAEPDEAHHEFNFFSVAFWRNASKRKIKIARAALLNLGETEE